MSKSVDGSLLSAYLDEQFFEGNHIFTYAVNDRFLNPICLLFAQLWPLNSCQIVSQTFLVHFDQVDLGFWWLLAHFYDSQIMSVTYLFKGRRQMKLPQMAESEENQMMVK